jgi:mRNA interferase RelE/StbE
MFASIGQESVSRRVIHSDRLLSRLSLAAAEVALPFWSMNLTLAPRQNWCAAISGSRRRRHRFDYEGKSGYIVARMPFAIVLAPEAVEDLRRLKANVRATMRSALETHLRRQEKTSRSRIKRLRGLRRPQYRLRVGDIRVFYDVSGTTVQVLAIVAKSEAEEWLAQFANLE